LLEATLKTNTKNKKFNQKLHERINEKIKIRNLQKIDFASLELETFKAMSNWYHLAILNLIELENFNFEIKNLSVELGISAYEVRIALRRLEKLNLIKKINNKYTRTQNNLFVKTKRSELAVRKFHSQMITKALEELKKVSHQAFDKRLINAITFACSLEDMELIKDKIDKFQEEILAFVAKRPKNTLYQMNIQYFPLTKKKK
jgi:uncharacterized protein (TIGR02147 family)